MSQFIGKYRTVVVNNIDPTLSGRIVVGGPANPNLGGQITAMPCAPFFGAGVGFVAVPPVGANVWVEFEGGDTDNAAIWTGGFWGQGEMPITLSNAGGLAIVTTNGLRIVLDDQGTIEFSNGHGAIITLVGPTVSVNQGALEVI
jgi:hypothetical protein